MASSIERLEHTQPCADHIVADRHMLVPERIRRRIQKDRCVVAEQHLQIFAQSGCSVEGGGEQQRGPVKLSREERTYGKAPERRPG